MRFCSKVAILHPKCYIRDMETVNPLTFNCNDLVYRRIDRVAGKDGYAPIMRKALSDEKDIQRKRRLKVLPFTVHDYEQDHPKVDLSAPFGNNINVYLCDALIYPKPTCRMRKLSLRATEFLLSLGSPTKELRMEYRKHLVDMAHASPDEEVIPGIRASFYEELIEIPLNGHFEYIYLIASRFGTLIDLINEEPCVYEKLRRSGKLDACTWLKRTHRPCPDGSWGTCPKETVRKEAGKYGSLQEFREANQAAYIRCRKEGWTWEFFDKPVPWNRRPISDIVAEAHRYGTVAEFRRHSPRAHAIARSAGLLARLFPAVQRRPNPRCRTVVQMDMEGNDIATFRSINEAARALGLTRDNGAICHACHGITDSAYGYRFRFG